MSKMNDKVYSCSIDLTIDLIGSKWSMWILYVLRNEGVARFGEIRKNVNGITEKMLIQELKKFESFDIINRKTYNQVPPKVEYSLTEYGHSLMKNIDQLFQWGDAYVEAHKDTITIENQVKFEDMIKYEKETLE